MSCNIRAIHGNIDERGFGKGRGLVTLSKLLANHNALRQLTNHNTFGFSEGGASSNPELWCIRSSYQALVTGEH